MTLIADFLLSLLAFPLFIPRALARPPAVDANITLAKDDFPSSPSWGRLSLRQSPKPFLLRVMPLGASITAGVGTRPQNGYRKPLRDQLVWRGWSVNMVGSRADGDYEVFKNRNHEGHPGAVVNEMIGYADLTILQQPNVILINVGTNNADLGNKQDLGMIETEMTDLIRHLLDKIEGTTIIVSTLLPRLDQWNSNINFINPIYRTIVRNFAAQGWKILLAEFNSNGLLDRNNDYDDAIHPNERGAAKLAAVWDKAILEAEERGFLTEPKDTGIPDVGNVFCEPTQGGGRGPVKTQQGSGEDDGNFSYKESALHDSSNDPNGLSYVYWNAGGTQRAWMAQLVNLGGAHRGGERDEVVICADEGPNRCFLVLNDNGLFSTSGSGIKFEPGLPCVTRGVRWGDVNGDGLDDFICINGDGNMYVSINRGGNPPKFEPLPNGGLIRRGEPWGKQERVRLADIDGDGRLDYCALDDKGDIYCWRNGGQGDAPTPEYQGYWQGMVGGEPTFFAQHEPEGIDGVFLVDINGDFRADWVYIYKDGSSKIFINQRGTYDEDGKGLRPHWVRAAASHGPRPNADPAHTLFGRVSGTGRADRIRYAPYKAPIGDGTIGNLQFWENQGAGGTKVKGDGVFYCDMFGRGYDDYLWVKSDGKITLYENIQKPPEWGQHGQIIDIQRDRKSIHFGDWDGDGLCDILAVERDTGRVEWWRNTYKTGQKSPTFDAPKWVVNDHLCDQGWGVGLYDQGLRFGDLDGDGRVDYLCMEKNGRTLGHLNKVSGLQDKGQVKLAPKELLDRANFRWADVTGDGLVDLIWVDKYAAGARVWKNAGFTPVAGSSMTWTDLGIRFEGHGRGQNIHFPILGNQKRADYHDVYPRTSIANTWYNECPPGAINDHDEPYDPHLPAVPGGNGGGGGDVEDQFDLNDLSFIDIIVAVGDSYSAGIGAGDRLGSPINALDPDSDYACSRYSQAYPYVLKDDLRFGDPKFQFLSCSGALIQDVLDRQMPRVEGLPATMLVSAGGNDAQLLNILNQCVFQWATLTQAQAEFAKLVAEADPEYEWAADYDWDLTARGCAEQLRVSRQIIESDLFTQSLDNLMTQAELQTKVDGAVYWTGYAKFFNTQTTECDRVTWTTWIHNTWQSDEYLTLQHRQIMNELVDLVNAKIAAVAARHRKVRFVNYDKYLDLFHGRFCEPGVDESTTESNTREGLMFYELNTFDPWGTTPWKRSDDSPLTQTWSGDMNVLTRIAYIVKGEDLEFANPEVIESAQSSMKAVEANSTDVNTLAVTKRAVPNLLPDGYGRVFHPQVLLHAIIAERVIFEMINKNMEDNGFDDVQEDLTLDQCPLSKREHSWRFPTFIS